MFADHKELSTEQLLTRLHELPESPWRDIKGRPHDDRGLAQRLQIRNPTTGTEVPQLAGYKRGGLEDAWSRLSPCLYRELDPTIMVMKSAEDGRRYDAAYVLDGAMDRSVFARTQEIRAPAMCLRYRNNLRRLGQSAPPETVRV